MHVCIYVYIYMCEYIHVYVYIEIHFLLQEEAYNQWCVDVCVCVHVRPPILRKGALIYSIFPVSMV